MRKLHTYTKVFDRSNEALGIEKTYIDVPLVVDLDEIIGYRKELEDNAYPGEIKYDGSVIYMRSGESFWINTEYEKVNSMISDAHT